MHEKARAVVIFCVQLRTLPSARARSHDVVWCECIPTNGTYSKSNPIAFVVALVKRVGSVGVLLSFAVVVGLG